MAREQFNDLLWFLAVAEERSFTRAAAKLGIAQSTLSHTIKRLETQMGIRLLTRTTRNVAPTEAGERLRQSLAPRVEEIEAEIASLMEFRDKPAGTIRITLSDHALQSVVWPKLRPVLSRLSGHQARAEHRQRLSQHRRGGLRRRRPARAKASRRT